MDISKSRLEKWDSLSYEKPFPKRIKKQAVKWGEIFAKDTPEKGLLPKIYKELLKVNNKTD